MEVLFIVLFAPVVAGALGVAAIFFAFKLDQELLSNQIDDDEDVWG